MGSVAKMGTSGALGGSQYTVNNNHVTVHCSLFFPGAEWRDGVCSYHITSEVPTAPYDKRKVAKSVRTGVASLRCPLTNGTSSMPEIS